MKKSKIKAKARRRLPLTPKEQEKKAKMDKLRTRIAICVNPIHAREHILKLRKLLGSDNRVTNLGRVPSENSGIWDKL